MKTLLALAAALLLSITAAFAADPVSDGIPTVANTAGVVVFEIDHVPQVLVFISKTGQVVAYPFAVCATNLACGTLAKSVETPSIINVNTPSSNPTVSI